VRIYMEWVFGGFGVGVLDNDWVEGWQEGLSSNRTKREVCGCYGGGMSVVGVWDKSSFLTSALQPPHGNLAFACARSPAIDEWAYNAMSFERLCPK
jgi:hypothetical protein